MCGIVGTVARPGRFARADLERATRSLSHRGPDDLGVERVGQGEGWEVWFGHARLSILDLSAAGHQPMVRSTSDGRHGAIVFNGEVYNHKKLRAALPPFDYRSHSDTEVLLHGLLQEGPDFLARTNGMLAAAYYDSRRGTLLLARDRLGKKPLYLYCGEQQLLFASELKAFHALGVPLTIDNEALAYYHWLRHIPAEKTIYRECRKLPAASWLEIDLREPFSRAPATSLFWDPLAACGTTFSGTYRDAMDEFDSLLDDATRIRLEADVPVGVFLSSGIDSSLVAASVARQHAGSVTAFIVKADDPALDESEVARRTAAKLGLGECVLDLRKRDYARQIERIPFHYDEPCAPMSQIPTMAIAEAARAHVTVVLTGDGGDEIFLGYPWFAYPERLFGYRKRLARIPLGVSLARRVLPTRVGTRALRATVRALGLNEQNLETKRIVAQEILTVRRAAELYDNFQALQHRSLLTPGDRAALGPARLLERAMAWYPRYSWEAAEARTTAELVAALELVTSMRDEILVKVDRGTMAHSLEARSPLLDHRVVELGLSLPASYKMAGGVFKRILRDACARRVDPALSGLKKRGFGIPAPAEFASASAPEVEWGRAVEAAWRTRWCS